MALSHETQQCMYRHRRDGERNCESCKAAIRAENAATKPATMHRKAFGFGHTDAGLWRMRGNCTGHPDPDLLFIPGADQQRIKRICRGCPVIRTCLADALANRIEFGVWGGTTERERHALLRRAPRDTDWHALLRADVEIGGAA